MVRKDGVLGDYSGSICGVGELKGNYLVGIGIIEEVVFYWEVELLLVISLVFMG